MIETAKMSDRGQIIIPKSIRDSIGANTDTIFAFDKISQDTIVMKKIDTNPLVKEFRMLRESSKKYDYKVIKGEIDAVRKSSD